MKNFYDELMYVDLSQLAKTVLCLSHANSDPERGFSENKYILENRGMLEEETLVEIRMDHINVTDFPISLRLLQLCSNARQFFFTFLEQQKVEKELIQRNQDVEEKCKYAASVKKSQSDKLSDIDKSLQLEEKKMDTAEGRIKYGNKIMADLINSKGPIDKKQLIKAQMLVESGVKKVCTIKLSVTELQKQKGDLLKKKK